MIKAVRKVTLAAAAAAAVLSAPAWAAAGWTQTAPGTYQYTDPLNWTDGIVDDTFDASLTLTDDTTTGVQTLTLGADYTPAGTMSFGFASPSPAASTLEYGFSIIGDGNRTLNIGDMTFTPSGADIGNGQRKRVLDIGSATDGQQVNINLGGQTRTFNIGTTGVTSQDRGEGVTLLNVVSNGSITKTGSGWLRLGGTTANTMTGLTVSQGVVRLQKTSGVAAVGGDITVNGGTLLFQNTYQLTDTTNINISSGGVYLAGTSGTSSSGGSQSPATPVGQKFANLTITGGVFNTGPRATGSAGGSGASTITGVMHVSGGTVAIRSRSTSFLANQVVLIGGETGPTISVQSGNSGTATFIIGEGGLSITHRDSGAYTPISVGGAGALTLRGNVTFTGVAGNAETTTINASAGRNLNLDGGTRTFTIDNGDAEVDLAINDNFTLTNGGLVKSGAGTLQIDSLSTYTGDTTVTGGRLVVNGGLTSATAVEAGVLAGTGAISAGVTVNAGSINPGDATPNSLGTFSTGNTVFGNGSTLVIDIGAAGASDVLAVNGDLDLGGLSALTVLGTADNSTYTIVTYTGSLTGVFNTLSLPANYSIDYGSGSNSAITISVPEPASLGLTALAGAGLLARRRCRRKR